jgi:hypothetical protein
VNRKPLLPPGVTIDRIGDIRVKHIATFQLKEFPFSTGFPAKEFSVDRWTPMGDTDKERVNAWKLADEGWESILTERVWFGLEKEDKVYPNHLFEYHNVVVIRPTLIDRSVVLDMIAYKVGAK